MGGFINLELKVFIPYFILAEILRFCLRAYQQQIKNASQYN